MEALGINVGYLILQVIIIGVIPLLIAVGLAVYLIRKDRSGGK